jgi:signal transduction histidine kinase
VRPMPSARDVAYGHPVQQVVERGAPADTRPWWPRRPPYVDIGIALVFVALAVSELLTYDTMESAFRHTLLSALPLATLAWRRQYPELVAGVVVVSNMVSNPTFEFTIVLSLVLCSYTVGSETDPPRSWSGLVVVLTPFLGTLFFENGFLPSDVAAAVVFIVGPWAVGAGLRRRTALAEAAVAEAEQRAWEQERQAREAAADERNRIARELHDIVSHSISVVTIQTQAVRRRLGPDHEEEARDLAMVEATAREALAEMRRLFGVLRTDGESASLAPQPGLGELRRLVASVGSGGPHIDVVERGRPVPLSPGVDLAAYRIAQEGLTNALRHAEASRITITVDYREQELAIEVRDDGRGPTAHHGAPGHGLVGIRERVTLYGGTVELEEVRPHGSRLAATLPLGEVRAQ